MASTSKITRYPGTALPVEEEREKNQMMMRYDIMIYDTDIILYIPMQGELFVEQFFSLLLYRVQYHIMRYDT